MNSDANIVKILVIAFFDTLISISSVVELSDHLAGTPIVYTTRLARLEVIRFINDFFEKMCFFDDARGAYRIESS